MAVTGQILIPRDHLLPRHHRRPCSTAQLNPTTSFPPQTVPNLRQTVTAFLEYPGRPETIMLSSIGLIWSLLSPWFLRLFVWAAEKSIKSDQRIMKSWENTRCRRHDQVGLECSMYGRFRASPARSLIVAGHRCFRSISTPDRWLGGEGVLGIGEGRDILFYFFNY